MIDLTALATHSGLVAAVSGIWAVLAVLIAPLRQWFESRDPSEQRTINGLIVLAIAIIAVVLGCAKIAVAVPCAAQDIFDYFINIVSSAITGLQTTKAVFGLVGYLDHRNEKRAALGEAASRGTQATAFWKQSRATKLF